MQTGDSCWLVEQPYRYTQTTLSEIMERGEANTLQR